MIDTELLPGETNCVKFTLNCMTGDLLNAGTAGSVYVCLFDAAGRSSGVRCLRTSESRTLFQRNQTDVFELFFNPPMEKLTSLNVLLQPKVWVAHIVSIFVLTGIIGSRVRLVPREVRAVGAKSLLSSSCRRFDNC